MKIKMFKKAAVLALSASMLMGLTASADVLENGRFDKINVALGIDPQDLEPDAVNNDPRFYFIYSLYETLFDMADDGSRELRPCMAAGYEEVDDTTWKITLRDNVYDWNGNQITSSDVKFSMDWLVESGNAIRFDYFDSVEVIDDKTFYMHWKQPLPAVSEAEFPLTRALVFSQASYEANGSFATAAVGTGAYKVKEFTSGSKLVLEANDDYWGLAYIDELEPRHRANVQEIEFQVITEASTAVVGLETGTVDLCSYVPIAMMEEFESGALADQYTTEVTVSGDYYYIAPNCLNLDENLRKAIFYAIDNASVATAMGGTYVPMDTFGTSYFNDYDESLILDGTYVTDYDMDKAKEYLAASDYDGRTLVLLTNNSEAARAAAQMVQAFLLQIGVQTEIQSVTQDNFQTSIAQESGWDLGMNTIGGPDMVGAWHLLFDDEVNGDATTCWVRDEELQNLYETACADATHDAEHMRACLDYVIEHAYCYSLVGTSSALVYSNKITDLYKREGYYTVAASTYEGQ